jgi:hypothetical protein
LLRLGVNPLGGLLFQLLHGFGVESKQVREFRKIDTFGAAWLFVTSNDAEGENVQRRSLRVVGYTCNDFRQRPRLRQLLLDDGIDPGVAGVFQNRRALLLADRAISVGC